MSTKINFEEASKLAIEKIHNMSTEELLTKLEERKNSTLAQAVRELNDFAYRGFSTLTFVEGNYFWAENITFFSAMNSEQYSLEELPNFKSKTSVAA